MNAEDAYVGQRVRIIYSEPEVQTGIIVELKPENGGCLVQPDGSAHSFGWGWCELDPLPNIVGPSVWELLRDPERYR